MRRKIMEKLKSVQVTICDTCKENETDKKCICGKDVCGECGYELSRFYSGLGYLIIGGNNEPNVYICRSHIDKSVLASINFDGGDIRIR